jgi:hypothetical protein
VTQCTFLCDSPLPGNGSFWKSHIHCLMLYVPVCWNSNEVHFTCMTMNHLAVSELTVEGFIWKFVSRTQRTFRIPKIENVGVGVWLYWCYTVWPLRVYFLYTLLIKKIPSFQLNRRNPVYFTTIARCVCCLWDILEQVRGIECAAGGVVVGVCVWA